MPSSRSSDTRGCTSRSSRRRSSYEPSQVSRVSSSRHHRGSCYYDSGSDSDDTVLPSESTSSISRTSSSTTCPKTVVLHSSDLTRVIGANDPDEWYSSDEEYILSQWRSQRPIDSYGQRYEDRPLTRGHGIMNYHLYTSSSMRTEPHCLEDSHSRVSKASSSHRSRHSHHNEKPDSKASRRCSHHSSSSSRHNTSCHYNDALRSGTSRRPSRSGSTVYSRIGEKAIHEKLRRLSLNHNKSRYHGDDDSEDELIIPATYRSSGNVAGSPVSRHIQHNRPPSRR